MNKRDFRKQLELYFSITHSGRECKILAERYAKIDHEGQTGVAIIIYRPEDNLWRDVDRAGQAKIYRAGEIRYVVIVDGKVKDNGIVDNWSHIEKE